MPTTTPEVDAVLRRQLVSGTLHSRHAECARVVDFAEQTVLEPFQERSDDLIRLRSSLVIHRGPQRLRRARS